MSIHGVEEDWENDARSTGLEWQPYAGLGLWAKGGLAIFAPCRVGGLQAFHERFPLE